MALAELLAMIKAAGIRLGLDASGNNLTVQSASPLTDAQRDLIRGNKAALLDHLRQQHTPPALTPTEHEAIAEAMEERAAIHQYDAGMTRQDAEKAANLAMRVYRYRLTDRPGDWLILIAPGCDLAGARYILEKQYGVERVLEVIGTGSDRRGQ